MAATGRRAGSVSDRSARTSNARWPLLTLRSPTLPARGRVHRRRPGRSSPRAPLLRRGFTGRISPGLLPFSAPRPTASPEYTGKGPEAPAMTRVALPHLVRRALARHAHANDTDGQLLDRFTATRDPAAFAELVERYAGLVRGACRLFGLAAVVALVTGLPAGGADAPPKDCAEAGRGRGARRSTTAFRCRPGPCTASATARPATRTGSSGRSSRPTASPSPPWRTRPSSSGT